MARRRGRNPVMNDNLLGENVPDAVIQAIGLGLTAAVNDNFVSKLVGKVLPALTSNHMIAKVVDAVTTLATGFALGEIVGVVEERIGREIRHGGAILAGGKAVSALIPGFQISATFPVAIPTFGFFGTPAPDAVTTGAAGTKQLPAGSAAGATSAMSGASAVFPRPVDDSEYAGF